MRIDQSHVRAFEAASLDHNPLHTNANYARRTPFGRPVVYGICGVVLALSEWAKGRAFALRSIRAVFRKPLFEGEEYRLEVTEGDKVQLRIGRGRVDYAIIVLEVDGLGAPIEVEESSPKSAQELPLLWSEVDMEPRSTDYCPALSPDFWQAFGLLPGQLPPAQLSTLLWSSYHVGMEMPGQQALYAELDVRFSDLSEASSHPGLRLDLEAAHFDDRFNRVMQSGLGTGIESFKIVAFRRPEPVRLAMPEEPVQNLEGKTIFISGASRGFGAQLALLAGCSGARLALNYRRDREGIGALADLLARHGMEEGKTFFLYQGDMSQGEEVKQMAAQIQQDIGNLDMLVNNAAPPIRDAFFQEQSSADFLRFVEMNLGIAQETVRHLQPLLADGGQVVHISTRYLVEPVGGFSHYLTAKHAQEGMMGALALEMPHTRFVVARLPRILTDQTNLPFDLDPPLPALEVAEKLLNQCGNLPEDGNHHVFNLW